MTEFGYMVIGGKPGGKPKNPQQIQIVEQGGIGKTAPKRTLSSEDLFSQFGDDVLRLTNYDSDENYPMPRIFHLLKFFVDNHKSFDKMKTFWKNLYISINGAVPKKINVRISLYYEDRRFVELVGNGNETFNVNKEYAYDFVATFILFRVHEEFERMKKNTSDLQNLQIALRALQEASLNVRDSAFRNQENKDIRRRLFSVIERDIAKAKNEDPLNYFNLLVEALGKKASTTIRQAKTKIVDFQNI